MVCNYYPKVFLSSGYVARAEKLDILRIDGDSCKRQIRG